MQTVSALRVAPVKALATVARDRLRLETKGAAEDRRLFLVHSDGSVVTQRRYPQLTRVVPCLDLSAGALTVDLPDGTTATADLSALGGHVRTTLFGKNRFGRLVPGPVADVLSEYVAAPLQLVLSDTTGIGWDEGPVSLIGSASASAVSPPDEPGSAATARFRMLVEVDGTAPYEEDSWIGSQLRIGEARLRVTHPLERCLIINHSPVTGLKDWPGLKTLAALRGPDRVTLGVIAQVEQPGDISVGDAVDVRRD